MKALQIHKRLVAFGVIVIGATILSLTLMFAGLSIDSLGVSSNEIHVSAVMAVTDSSDTQQAIPIIERDPMADSFPAFDSMSPAEALTNGKPTLFFFQPYELCQNRYCRHPASMADELQAGYQDSVNFVYVTAYAKIAHDDSKTQQPLLFDNWDLYLVPPIADWLPRSSITEFGLSLEAPVAFLIDSTGNLVYQSDEFFTMDELEPDLRVLLGERGDDSLTKVQ